MANQKAEMEAKIAADKIAQQEKDAAALEQSKRDELQQLEARLAQDWGVQGVMLYCEP